MSRTPEPVSPDSTLPTTNRKAAAIVTSPSADDRQELATVSSRYVPNTFAIVRFDPQTEKFQSWAIPGGGDIVRNMDVTPDGNPVTANSLTNQVGLVEIK